MNNSPSLTLTDGSVFGHLVRLAIPASMGMIFNTLYNLSDFWFAGKLSDDALSGVSIAGSVFFLLLAIGIGVQTGASAVIAPEAGKGDNDAVADWVDQVFGLSLFLSVVISIVGLWVSEPLVRFLGAEENIAPLSMEYVTLTLYGSFTFVLSFAAAGALMALGDTKSNRNALALGFFINLALNPLLTFSLELGVTGLALATVLIKAASAVYLFWVLGKSIGRIPKPKLDVGRWLALLKQVLPASFNMLTIILGGFITVSLIGRFGSDHVAGYAVGLRLEQVLLLQYDRVLQTYKTALGIGLLMAVVSIPIMIFLSPAMMNFFTDSSTIQETGAAYLKIDAIAFYAYVVLFLSTAILQSMKQPFFPMILGILRQLIIPVSVNYWLIVERGYPMISIFYTIISVVVIASMVAHMYTLRQLRLFIGSSETRGPDTRLTSCPSIYQIAKPSSQRTA